MNEDMIPVFLQHIQSFGSGAGYIEQYAMIMVNRGYVENKRQETLNVIW